jgi:hypothetical protein
VADQSAADRGADAAVSPAARTRSPLRLRSVVAAAWIGVALIAYLQQFSAYVRPILALLH